MISSIYGILFWDVIYDDSVTDVFRSSLQAAPLDLHCPSFATSRSSATSKKLQELRNASTDEIIAISTAVWEKYRTVYSPSVNWDIFPSLEYLTEILKCFTSVQLAAICERFCLDFGAVRAGFPDLTVWNPVEQQVKIVEVKGPTDSLSFKQILWIDFLMGIDVPVEVCHVVASGANGKRKFSTETSQEKPKLKSVVLDDIIVI